MARVHRAVSRVAATEDDDVLAREGIDVVHGRARFRSPTAVEIDGLTIGAKRLVVATGATPDDAADPWSDRGPAR
ncbi:MAG: hypothetical protein KatS3mg010_0878 [Acidimicrobiia bacterium]|nr:MAG: hypothetical protein KatS3mg010_0878 [Acidimicrobiia bacterium]